MKALLKKVKPFAIPIVITLVMLILFRVVFMLGYVPSESMEPTLKAGSFVLGLRIHGELKNGDIIIFKHDGTYMVKRIAATEGDIIIRNGQTQTVPEDCFYVLGDNRDNSYDSRYWEYPYVKWEDVYARVILPIYSKKKRQQSYLLAHIREYCIMVMIMKDVFKCVALVALGLITAVFLYPILHETGHSLATVLCGAEVEEITLFPLPSVLCKMGDLKASAMVMIGFGGMALPYLLTVFSAPKNFWIWYIWLLIKGITLLSFAISVIAIDMYFASNPMANEDMTQILKYAPEYSVLYTVFLTVMGVGIVWQIVRSKPLKRCMKQFDL